MKTIYNIFIALVLSLLLFSCGGFKLNKKATSGEEFLIEKKDPLILPPDFSKLPKPNEQPETNDKDVNIKSVFNRNQNSQEENKSQSTTKSNIKKSISEKIQN